MELNHSQKKYIKKHLKNSNIQEIARNLKVNDDVILEYVKKRWGDRKIHGFEPEDSSKKTSQINLPLNVSSWLKNNWLSLSILLALILITYGNALNNSFVSDDIAEIAQNPNIGDLSTIATRPFGFIRLIFNWAAFHIGGLNPAIFRSINFFLHIGSVFLLYTILTTIHSKRVAIFASSIFAIHPAISEAVVWISGGIYPQYTFFFLLSFLFYILGRENKYYYWLSVLVFSFTFMSHHAMPLALFILFPMFEFTFGNLKKHFKKVFPYILITIINLIYDMNGIPSRVDVLQSVHYQERGIDNLFILIPVAISSYFELIFWPKILTLYHSELAFSNIQFVIRGLVALLYFGLIIISFLKNRQIFFWLSIFILGLVPTLTPLRLNWIVAERYIYLPSIGIFIAIALMLDRLSKLKNFKPFVYVVFAVTIILLSTRTIIRNIDWKNEDNLWIATGKTSPSSPNTHNNLGDVYGRWGDKQRALQEFQTAILLKPNYADAFHNLANTYLELNDTEKAIENYTNAIKFNPGLWQSYQNIAAIYFQQKKFDLTLDFIQKAVTINPKNINLKVNLGIVYLATGEKDKAKEVFVEVLRADPQNQIAKQGLIETQK